MPPPAPVVATRAAARATGLSAQRPRRGRRRTPTCSPRRLAGAVGLRPCCRRGIVGARRRAVGRARLRALPGQGARSTRWPSASRARDYDTRHDLPRPGPGAHQRRPRARRRGTPDAGDVNMRSHVGDRRRPGGAAGRSTPTTRRPGNPRRSSRCATSPTRVLPQLDALRAVVPAGSLPTLDTAASPSCGDASGATARRLAGLRRRRCTRPGSGLGRPRCPASPTSVGQSGRRGRPAGRASSPASRSTGPAAPAAACLPGGAATVAPAPGASGQPPERSAIASAVAVADGRRERRRDRRSAPVVADGEHRPCPACPAVIRRRHASDPASRRSASRHRRPRCAPSTRCTVTRRPILGLRRLRVGRRREVMRLDTEHMTVTSTQR